MTLASGWIPMFPPVVHLASSAVTPTGSVHKSTGDNVVRMWVEMVYVVCVSVKEGA